MTPTERKLYEKLDKIVLDAPKDELKKIQIADKETQLNGLSFYDSYNIQTMKHSWFK